MSNTFAMSTVGRLPNVLSADGHKTGAQRAAQSARKFSKRNVYVARAKLLQQAMELLVELTFETFPDSIMLSNVDASGRLLVAVPWSRVHYRAYGIRRQEGDALRAEMMARCELAAADPALYVYLPDFKRWFVDLHAYPALTDGMLYIEQNPVTWRTLASYSARQK